MSEMSEYQLGRPACNGVWHPHPFQVYAMRSCNKAGKMLSMWIGKLAAIVRYVPEGVEKTNSAVQMRRVRQGSRSDPGLTK